MTKLTFLNDIAYHKRVTRLDMVHHLLGNGQIQAMVQVTEHPDCPNALVLHLMNPARYENRPKSYSLTFHQQAGPELTAVALYDVAAQKLYTPNPRQTAADLRYGMTYDGDVPAFEATWLADYTLDGARHKSPFNVRETFFTPMGFPALVRRVTVSHRRGLEPAEAKLFAFLVPNQALFPEAHFVTAQGAAVAGHFGQGDEFLALAPADPNALAAHQVAMFPDPLDAAFEGGLGASCDDGQFVVPPTLYTNYPLLPNTPHLGPTAALQFDLGTLEPGASRSIDLIYAYGVSEAEVLETIATLRTQGYDALRQTTGDYYRAQAQMQTGDARLDKFYAAVRAGIRAGVAQNGSMNAAIWGYNAEWVRDSSLASVGATLSGQFDEARAMLEHMLRTMFNEDGLAFGESQFYALDRAELDQNAELLYALWMYWTFSRDASLIDSYWNRLIGITEFPLRPEFWVEEASMVQSTRDIRERDAERHGLKPGFELAYQAWVSLGLQKAADMARYMGDDERAARWADMGARIWGAALNHPTFRLVENDYLMKRRLLDGSFQYTAHAVPYIHKVHEDRIKVYPRSRNRGGGLEPDFSETYPITLGLLDAQSTIARRTLIRMESTWNQEWDFGGYPLHNTDSEPTKLGAWPMPFYVITQALIEARQYDLVRRNLDWVLQTRDGEGYTWWEYRDANPDYQIDHGITPWFVYGEPIVTFIYYFLGFRPRIESLVIQPHLLPEWNTVSAGIRLGSARVSLTLHNDGCRVQRVEVNGDPWPDHDGESITLPVPETDTRITIWLGD